ncbi:MAG TPA: glycosyltransferase [Roseiflexaceae bacterium]|nr:glycosyltransferase [Roseiflexaceae bacterium]
MRILFISAYVPSRIRVRPYSFIKALAGRGHAVTLVCGAGADDAEALNELHKLCRRVVAVPTGAREMAWNALRALAAPMPLQAALNFAPDLLAAVQREARAGHDVAHIEHLRASALGYGTPLLPTVLDSVDCISLLFERTLRSGPSLRSRALALLDLARTRRYEADYTRRYDRVLVTSPEDAWALELLADAHPAAPRSAEQASDGLSSKLNSKIAVIPNGVDLDYFRPPAQPRAPATLVFTGKMSYHANTAAALMLAREIMPLVWAQRPDTQLTIAGSAPPAEVQALAADNRVRVTGYVPDLRPYLAQATLAVAPLRYGVGIQNKVLEAMAMGAPVVAARQVARALRADDGAELRFAEQPEEYAGAILDLLDSPNQRARLSRAGRAYVEQRHDWQHLAADLEQVYQDAISR